MSSVNNFDADTRSTPERSRSERHVESVREQGGVFVHAVRVTRMPMMVTDARLPGNPITFANEAFLALSGYSMDEVLGQTPHFMDGPETDTQAVDRFQATITEGRDEALELVQYRKDGMPFRAALFGSPLDDGQGKITNHFLSYLDVTRRYEAEEQLRRLAADLELRVEARTQELNAANERLSALVAEKEMLLVEVNHRAKNSISVAASLMAVQGRRQHDESVRALFQETESRLHAISRAHDLLSKSADPREILLAPYLRDLCSSLSAMTDPEQRLVFSVDVAEDIHLGTDRAIPIGLIVTELVTNAVKYAFPAAVSGAISVNAMHAGGNSVVLSVRDDGVGLSRVREGSLGFGIVHSLAQQLGATMTIESNAGVLATLTFPR